MSARMFLCVLLTVSVFCFQTSTGRLAKRSDDVSSLETVVHQQGVTIQALQAELSALKGKVTTIESDLQDEERHKQVAFHAHMTGNWTLPLDIDTHGTLKFGTAVSNVGSGYNTHTGIFTAPYPGTYLFLLTVLATDYAELEIVENTGRRLAMTGGDRDQVNEDFRRDTVHTALHLNKGDEVWVRHAHSGTTVMQFWWTSFTGVLLQSD